MKIVLGAPLYPPEVTESAAYVKELAGRLSGSHDVSVVAYAHLPESVPGVAIVAVDKRRPLPLRLARYLGALWRAARAADVIYAENGPSVELPAVLVSLFGGRPLVMHIGDRKAHERAQRSWARRFLERLACRHARAVIRNRPLAKPEILPLEPYPAAAFEAYERSWSDHMDSLERAFRYAR